MNIIGWIVLTLEGSAPAEPNRQVQTSGSTEPEPSILANFHEKPLFDDFCELAIFIGS